MTSTNRGELKCTTDSEVPKKMVAKGSRSSTRRDKKPIVRVAASDIDQAEDKSSTEPKKLLGHHLAEREEHVPIKKRRFRVLSPSPKKSHGRCGSSKRRTQSNHALPVSRSNPNLVDGGTSDGCTEKKNKSSKNVRLHWDLNVPMEAWSQPCDVEDDASERDVKGEITESMAPKESKLIDGSKDHLDGSKGEAAARNDKKCQSGYESQLEEGELREENEGDAGEDDGLYSKEDPDKKILADAPRIGEANDESDIEKHVVASKELPSHDATKRIRYDDHEELGMDPYKSSGRDDRSRMRMRGKSSRRRYFSGWDSRRLFSSPNYIGGFYGFERPGLIYDPGMMMDGFDQSRPWSQVDGYVCHQFWNGHFSMFNNQFPGWVHNPMSGNMRERGNPPTSRRLHHSRAESRSRSRSPVPRNGRNGMYPPRGGFRGGKRMMERLRFPADQEMRSMSPPRNRKSSPRSFKWRRNDSGENHNSFKERKKHDVGNSDNENNSKWHKRFGGAEDNTGGNKFEMAQQQTKSGEVLEDGNDDTRRFRFKEK